MSQRAESGAASGTRAAVLTSMIFGGFVRDHRRSGRGGRFAWPVRYLPIAPSDQPTLALDALRGEKFSIGRSPSSDFYAVALGVPSGPATFVLKQDESTSLHRYPRAGTLGEPIC